MWREKIGLLPVKTTPCVRFGTRCGAGRCPLQVDVAVVSVFGPAEGQAQDDRDDTERCECEATDVTATV